MITKEQAKSLPLGTVLSFGTEYTYELTGKETDWRGNVTRLALIRRADGYETYALASDLKKADIIPKSTTPNVLEMAEAIRGWSPPGSPIDPYAIEDQIREQSARDFPVSEISDNDEPSTNVHIKSVDYDLNMIKSLTTFPSIDDSLDSTPAPEYTEPLDDNEIYKSLSQTDDESDESTEDEAAEPKRRRGRPPKQKPE